MADENNDGANDNDFPIPNNHEGWGRINLDAATDGTIQFVEEATSGLSGGSQVFNVTRLPAVRSVNSRLVRLSFHGYRVGQPRQRSRSDRGQRRQHVSRQRLLRRMERDWRFG
ncbi:MAG: hypothetical protein U0V48_19305 [Anaerolineales bacterium]